MPILAKKVLNKVALLLMTVLVLVSSLNIGAALAETTSYSADSMHTASVMRMDILDNTSYAGGNSISGFDSDDTQIGIDAYGTGLRFTKYTGEVPVEADNWSDYPSEAQTEFLGLTRLWATDPNVYNTYGWNSDTSVEDLHAKYLMYGSNFLESIINFLGSILGAFLYAIGNLLTQLIGWIVNIACADVGGLVSALPFDNLSETISSLIIVGDNGFSPIFILALAIFVIGLAGSFIKFLTTGGAALSGIIQEALICLLALVIAFGSTSGLTTLNSAVVSLSEKVLSGITTDSAVDTDSVLFTYNSDSASTDLANNLKAQIAKLTINSMIIGQFGYQVDELYLWGDGVSTQELWGISENTMKSLVKQLTDENSEDIFAITVSKGDSSNGTPGSGTSNKDNPNIGYYWYVVAGGVNPYNPYTEDSSGNLVSNSGEEKLIYFIIDLMAAIDKEADGSAKAQAIMNSFHYPSTNPPGAALNILLMVAIGAAVVLAAFLCLVFKVLFNLGLIFVPFIPILLLIKHTREVAKKGVMTWLFAAVIMVATQLMIVLTIQITVQIATAGGAANKLIAIILAIGFAVLTPKLIAKIISISSETLRPYDFARRTASGVAERGRVMRNMAGRNLYEAVTPKKFQKGVDHVGGTLKRFGQDLSDIANDRYEVDNKKAVEETEARIAEEKKEKEGEGDTEASKDGSSSENQHGDNNGDNNAAANGSGGDEEISIDNDGVEQTPMFDFNPETGDLTQIAGEDVVDNQSSKYEQTSFSFDEEGNIIDNSQQDEQDYDANKLSNAINAHMIGSSSAKNASTNTPTKDMAQTSTDINVDAEVAAPVTNARNLNNGNDTRNANANTARRNVNTSAIDNTLNDNIRNSSTQNNAAQHNNNQPSIFTNNGDNNTNNVSSTRQQRSDNRVSYGVMSPEERQENNNISNQSNTKAKHSNNGWLKIGNRSANNTANTQSEVAINNAIGSQKTVESPVIKDSAPTPDNTNNKGFQVSFGKGAGDYKDEGENEG